LRILNSTLDLQDLDKKITEIFNSLQKNLNEAMHQLDIMVLVAKANSYNTID